MPDIREFLNKKQYDTQDLRRVIEILRAPEGCPWDAKQTHESIRKNFIEETYEVIEAINKGDDALLCEELGDVLLQVALHTQMASERGAFDWDSVTDGICRKLIERHPHVFGDVRVTGVDDVLSNWDAIKRETKGQGSTIQAMASVPRELPALMRATKLQKKAAKEGFDWPGVDGALERLEEEIRELRAEITAGNPAGCREELGDVLFSAVNVSRFLPDCDAEEALTAASDKFLTRFASVEQSAIAEGINMKETPLEELDRLWANAKNCAAKK